MKERDRATGGVQIDGRGKILSHQDNVMWRLSESGARNMTEQRGHQGQPCTVSHSSSLLHFEGKFIHFLGLRDCRAVAQWDAHAGRRGLVNILNLRSLGQDIEETTRPKGILIWVSLPCKAVVPHQKVRQMQTRMWKILRTRISVARFWSRWAWTPQLCFWGSG